MAARFKSIEDKGGLPIHLMTHGIEPEYFYHLHELGLKNTVIKKLLWDKYGRDYHRTTIANWRSHIKGNNGGDQEKEDQSASNQETGVL